VLALAVVGGREALKLSQQAARVSGATTEERSFARLLADPAGRPADQVAAARSAHAGAAAELNRARDEVAGDPVLGILAALPLAGDQVVAFRDLVTAASDASDALSALQPVALPAGSAGGAPDFLNRLSAAAPRLAAADRRLRGDVDRLRADQRGHLLAPVRRQVDRGIAQVQPNLDALDVAATSAQVLPAAFGASGSRRYLVLLPNPSELRPAGGFDGAIGEVTVVNGTATSIQIQPETYYNPLRKQHFDVPPELGRYLSFAGNSLEIGDSGWDPNFPDSARLAESIFASATQQQVDGTISVDPYAIQAFLAITGPVDVPGYGTFTSTDFFSRTNFIVHVQTGPNSGKPALTPIGNAVMAKLLGQPADRWPRLAQVLQEQVTQRHVQAYAHDSALEAFIQRTGASGELETVPLGADYVFAADANVGGNKVDYYVRKSLDVKVERSPTGIARHEVTVHYEVPLPVDDTDRLLNKPPNYRTYLRIYVPETASINSLYVDRDGAPSTANAIDAITIQHGRRVVATFLRGRPTVLDGKAQA